MYRPSRALFCLFLFGSLGLFCTPGAFGQDSEPAQDAVAIFNRAQDVHEKGDLAGAIKLYEQALKILPEFPEAEYQRGTAEIALVRPRQKSRFDVRSNCVPTGRCR
jgi:tetratricopeptide (TPR) repeat protein